MTRTSTNWPSFWAGLSEAVLAFSAFALLILWLAVLPTVGVLYFLGGLA